MADFTASPSGFGGVSGSVTVAAGFRAALSGTLGGSPWSLATGFYAPRALTVGQRSYASIPTALTTAFEAIVGAGNAQVAWSSSTGRYSIQFASSETLVVDATAQLALGLPSGPLVGTWIQSRAPYYVIVGAQGALSAVSDDYEADGLTEGRITEDGTPYSVSATGGAVHFDAELPMEPHEAVYARKALVTAPWTWEHFFAHVRGSHPFALDDGTDARACVLRPSATSFAPRRVVPDYDGLWTIRLETYVLEHLS